MTAYTSSCKLLCCLFHVGHKHGKGIIEYALNSHFRLNLHDHLHSRVVRATYTVLKKWNILSFLLHAHLHFQKSMLMGSLPAIKHTLHA